MYLGRELFNGSLYLTLNTHNPTTGASQAADSAPIYRVYKDNTVTPIASGTFSLFDSANTTGYYEAVIPLTAANGFTANLKYNIYVEATVNSIKGTTTKVVDVFDIFSEPDISVLFGGEIVAVDSGIEFRTSLVIGDTTVDGLLFVLLTGGAEGQCKYIEDSFALNGRLILDDEFVGLPGIGDKFVILANRKGAD